MFALHVQVCIYIAVSFCGSVSAISEGLDIRHACTTTLVVFSLSFLNLRAGRCSTLLEGVSYKHGLRTSTFSNKTSVLFLLFFLAERASLLSFSKPSSPIVRSLESSRSSMLGLPIPASSTPLPSSSIRGWFFVSDIFAPPLPQGAPSSSSSPSSLSSAARYSARRSAAAAAAVAATTTGSFSRCRSGEVDVFKLNLSPYEEYMATRFVVRGGKTANSDLNFAVVKLLLYVCRKTLGSFPVRCFVPFAHLDESWR